MNAAAPTGKRQSTSTSLIWPVFALILIMVGFLGVDPWFYDNISLKINTENPISGDFYQSYKTVFWAVRIVPYVVFALVVWLIAMNNIGPGWRGAVAAISGVLAGGVAANFLQMSIGRMRPNAADSHLSFHAPFTGLWSGHPDGFPSGEAAATMAIAAALCLILPRLSILWIAMGLLGPIVRVLPGMHYFSDVVAGALVGMLLAGWVGRLVLQKLQPPEQDAETN